MRYSRLIIAGIVLPITLNSGARRVGPAPPLGFFLDPVNGAWAVAAAAELPRAFAAQIPTLDDEVRVVYDARAVPHIFARSVEDATRALGYVVARDRLFQLEVQTRATAGTLTELLGESVLNIDRFQRFLGLAWSAEKEFPTLDPDAVRLLEAYAEGVNSWIDQLKPRDLPLEYRLLNAWPQPWKPVYSSYVNKRIGYTINYSDHDRRRLRVETLVGKVATDALFPVNSPIQEPIQPNGRDSPRFDVVSFPPPGEPGQTAGRRGHMLEYAWSRLADLLPYRPTALPPGGEGWGGGAASNNWAVAPHRTANGHTLLAGDPHLNLTLPSIWYEAHLVVPGELDVYGVTIPGAAVISIGFNRDVAWSFTATANDVLDYYEEVLDDSLTPSRYLLDGQLRPLDLRIEEFRGRSGDLLVTDTVYHTHRGPVLRDASSPLSIRWSVLERSGSEALFVVSRAKSVEEWLDGMAGWRTPVLSGVVADRHGNIALRSTGTFPIRPRDGFGNVIRDGSKSENDWVGFRRVGRYPLALNPEQGYVASANQQPIDPEVDDGYLGVNWFPPWRAMQINKLLRADSAVTLDAMRRYQTDPGSARADVFAPALIEAARATLVLSPDDERLREAVDLLAEWDRQYTRDNERAVLFELAMNELVARTWDELETPETGRRVATPRASILAALLMDPQSVWWDHRETADLVEDRDRILAASLRAALVRAKREYGDPNAGGWRWSRIRHTNIYHLLELRSLSAVELPIQGGPSTLNPSSGNGVEGASWRMVVDLGPDVRAWAVYPGGQSGNPASPYYLDRLDKWLEGELDPVPFPREPGDLDSASIAGVLTLYPAN